MIRPAIKTDSTSLASLHVEPLITSFLASLGLYFLSDLYLFLIKKEKVWVYGENKEMKGFASFSLNSASMMTRFLISWPFCLFSLILRTIVHASNIKHFFGNISSSI